MSVPVMKWSNWCSDIETWWLSILVITCNLISRNNLTGSRLVHLPKTMGSYFLLVYRNLGKVRKQFFDPNFDGHYILCSFAL
jgi:hypothetical protein